MRQAASFPAIPGTGTQVSLLYRSGYIEILNDSNYIVIVTMNTGQLTILPSMCYLFPTPKGGSALTCSVSPLAGGVYLSADQGPANAITVQEYLEGEVVATGYPFMINRSIAPQNNIINSIVSGTAASSSTGLTVTCPPVAFPTFLYLQGYDLFIDQEATAHAMTATITGLCEGVPNALGQFSALTLNMAYHSQVTGTIRDYVRYNQAIRAFDGNTSIVFTIPAVTGGAAKIVVNLYCTCL